MSNKISLIKTKAIILKREPFKEADYIYTILTKNWGKLITTAHGTRKNTSKLKGFLEPLNYGDVILTNNPGRKILVSIEVINSFLKIRSNLEKLLTANFLIKITDRLILEEKTDLKLWQLIYNALQFLNQPLKNFSTEDSLKIQKIFLIRIFEVLGYGRLSSPEKFFYELIGENISYFNLTFPDEIL